MSIVSLLTVLFVALKLTNVIAWSWIWVLSPVLITFSLIVVVVIFVGLFKLVSGKF